jgi:hypothetical protein
MVEVVPSPKCHFQEVELPGVASVNCISCPALGEAGLNVKTAALEGITLIVRPKLFDPEPLLPVSVTL